MIYPPHTWVTRRQWRAALPNRTPTRAQHPWARIHLHHSVTGDGRNDAAVMVRNIQREHLTQRYKNGNLVFPDIAYTTLASQNGESFIGRGEEFQHGNEDAKHSGAICAIGNFEIMEPTDALLDAIAWQCVDWFFRGIASPVGLTGGHRDLEPTACPGSRLYARIPEINERAGIMAAEVIAKLAPKPKPTPPPPVVKPPKTPEEILSEDDMFIAVVPNPHTGSTERFMVNPAAGERGEYAKINDLSWLDSGLTVSTNSGWLHMLSRLGFRQVDL